MLYKSKFLTLGTIVYSLLYIDEYRVWAQVAVFTHVMYYVGLFGTCLFLGKAPRTKETLPDFRERCRVTRHS